VELFKRQAYALDRKYGKWNQNRNEEECGRRGVGCNVCGP